MLDQSSNREHKCNDLRDPAQVWDQAERSQDQNDDIRVTCPKFVVLPSNTVADGKADRDEKEAVEVREAERKQSQEKDGDQGDLEGHVALLKKRPGLRRGDACFGDRRCGCGGAPSSR